MNQPAKLFRFWMRSARVGLFAMLLVCLVNSSLRLLAAGNPSTNWPALSELLKKWQTVSLPEVQRLAEAGDASALHYLGYCHAEGLRVPPDPAGGAAWYRRAIQAGYLPSANNLGLLYQRGRLGTNDLAKAIEWYRYAADRGLAQSQANLGILYREGEGVPADMEEALRWFRLAASQGHPVAMVEIGRAYRFGDGVATNLDEAIRWFEKATSQKSASDKDRGLARLNLGLLYEEKGDADEAVPFYRQAAEEGQTDAMVQLYLCYWSGNGVERDRAKAMEWLRKAAEARSPWAECLMGYRCEQVEWVGEGTERHLTRPDLFGALRWYRRSAEQGWAGGQYHLGMMYLEGKAVAPDEARALELIRAAADQDLKDANYQLAELYACGIGEPRHHSERPVALLERIGKWGDLKIRYENGWGTDRDLVMAARCYSKMVLNSRWNYSPEDLAKMIEYKPVVGGSSGMLLIFPMDRHLTLGGPPHPPEADAVLSHYLKSALGDGATAFRIGECYDQGLNTPKSAPAAWAWFNIAARNGNAKAREEIRKQEERMSPEELKSAQTRLSELQADLKKVATALRQTIPEHE